jgi:hypothetical protein
MDSPLYLTCCFSRTALNSLSNFVYPYVLYMSFYDWSLKMLL